MFKELKALLDKAYTPCSNFKVSAIIVTMDNQNIKGVNVELPSFISSMCAERNALHSAFTMGYKPGDFKEIHIMSISEEFIYPCNVCRQTIAEFCSNDLKIFLYNSNGDTKELAFNDIIINSYTKEDLV